MAHVEAVGYGFSPEKHKVGSCGNPRGGTSSAPVKKLRIVGNVTVAAKMHLNVFNYFSSGKMLTLPEILIILSFIY